MAFTGSGTIDAVSLSDNLSLARHDAGGPGDWSFLQQELR